ncbi:MAG: acyl-CoA dehydratase activase-related protein [Oscillospiraceae bacterium]|jgi:predicted CoA-substrate-specific enzyme activase
MAYRIGLDIGSTTIKCAVLDAKDQIVYKSYERHMAKVTEKAVALIRSIDENIVRGEPCRIVITGSAGLGVSQSSGVEFVQEVYATQVCMQHMIPDADVVIELGGEDAKILFLTGGTEVRMNGSCAGGTGAFIDQMATLLGVTTGELDELSRNYEKIYTIASRCGVFAKSDIQPLLNQGARKSDIAASIFQSVVNQTVGGLSQGRDIAGKVVFLGGPLTFLQGLRERFLDTLQLGDNAVFPEDAQYYIALGAAFYAGSLEPVRLQEVLREIKEAKPAERDSSIPPLFADQQEYDAFLARHNRASVKRVPLTEYSGDAYLGVDAGSTTTKLVLISPDGDILYESYTSNSGNPVPLVKKALEEIYRVAGDRVRIKGATATGYGEELIKNAFHIDYGIVETIAHFTAARYFNPGVDFIIDIGGQDIKCFKIRNGAIDSIMLNEACSSGCGSFIETFAHALGFKAEEFAKFGLFAEHPVDLGSRCTVFMNSSVKQAQKDGATVGDIAAGLAVSVVKNALYKVIRANSTKELGSHIVVQGGTFLNDAVLRAFEREVRAEVVRPSIAGLMGAYGAALYAQSHSKERSDTIGLADLAAFSHEVSVITCKGCTNHCKLTVNKFADGGRYISGNKCEKPLGLQKAEGGYNAFQYKYDYLHSLKGVPGPRGKIGIPMGLNMYENLPFWHAFFTSLGFEVVLSPRSDRKLYEKGQHTIPSDTVCYPAKLLHGHVEALLDEGVPTIFYPCMSYNFDEGLSDNNYNCPVVAYYPEVIGANIKRLSEVQFIKDYLGLHRRKDFIKKAHDVFNQYFSVSQAEIKTAAEKAYTAYEDYRSMLYEYGQMVIDEAEHSGKTVIVLAGRPYHIDPEINHGIDLLVRSFGVSVLTEDCLTLHADKKKAKVLNQWTYHARLYAAAHYVGTHDCLQLVQLVSFGCGLDAITADEVREILESYGKLYTQIKIDEVTNLGAVKIRLRSLFAYLDANRQAKA